MAETAARVAELAGDPDAAAVVERHWTAPDGRTAAGWDRLVGPLLSLRPDPARVRLDPLRIRTPRVNRHFMAPGGEGMRMDLRPALGAVRCPTLVLVGERDPLIPVPLAGEAVDALPAGLGRLQVVAGAAHELFDDNPAEVEGAVRAFLG
jgi:pimeloyl-ACP methyl ester carboxylesterase